MSDTNNNNQIYSTNSNKILHGGNDEQQLLKRQQEFEKEMYEMHPLRRARWRLENAKLVSASPSRSLHATDSSSTICINDPLRNNPVLNYTKDNNNGGSSSCDNDTFGISQYSPLFEHQNHNGSAGNVHNRRRSHERKLSDSSVISLADSDASDETSSIMIIEDYLCQTPNQRHSLSSNSSYNNNSQDILSPIEEYIDHDDYADAVFGGEVGILKDCDYETEDLNTPTSTTSEHKKNVAFSRFTKVHYTYSRDEYDRKPIIPALMTTADYLEYRADLEIMNKNYALWQLANESSR